MNNTAFVFPGQGSQRVGMLVDAAKEFPIIQQLFDEASALLEINFWKIVTEGPVDELNQTIHTQPIMLTADVALWKVWQEQNGFIPDSMAGHSLGEYAALVVAGAIDFSDAVRLVFMRAKLMQEAVPKEKGAMAVIIGLDRVQVETVCEELSSKGIVEAVNFNAPNQTVIAGETDSVNKAINIAKLQGARLTKKLNVSVPSHCQLMKPAAEKFSSHLKNITIQSPTIPIINNVDVEISERPEAIREALTRQLYSPVRWVETIELMIKKNIHTIAECGPGKVLTGLNKKINSNLKLLSFDDFHAMVEFIK